MTNLKQRQSKIQEKRKSTTWKQFATEIASWFPLVFHKNQWRISRYPDERIWEIVSNKEFAEHRDDLLKYWKEIDLQKWVFETIHELMQEVPLGATIQQMAGENTEYADSVVASSHTYLSAAVINNCSNVMHSYLIFDYCENIYESVRVSTYSEDVFHSLWITKSSRVFYSKYITNSSNIWFSVNLVWCSECIWCSWLENQSYCIQNVPYQKEEYFQKKKKLLRNKKHYDRILNSLPKKSMNYGSEHVDWNHIVQSTNIESWFCINRLTWWRNVAFIGGEHQEKNFFDVFDGGVWSTDMYANEWTWSRSSQVYCSSQIEYSSQIFYSYYLVNCSYCFWCVWLQNKQYCIFNKEYEKEAWNRKVDEIFAHMEKGWILWEFFPWWMNPFYVNDTAAVLLTDLTKEEVLSDWFLRREEVLSAWVSVWTEMISVDELSVYEWYEGDIRKLDAEIKNKIIWDDEWNVWKVTKKELQFLEKYELPLPRRHWLERVKGHFERG